MPHESRVVSAHRTPDLLFRYAQEARDRGLRCIIAGAGGAAHLPGMLAAKTPLPVLGVPVVSKHLQGLDSLLSIVQMPAGVPVATFAIGAAGAHNATYAVALLAVSDPSLARRLDAFRAAQTDRVLALKLRGRRDSAGRRRRDAGRRPARTDVHVARAQHGLSGDRAGSRPRQSGGPRGRSPPPSRRPRELDREDAVGLAAREASSRRAK